MKCETDETGVFSDLCFLAPNGFVSQFWGFSNVIFAFCSPYRGSRHSGEKDPRLLSSTPPVHRRIPLTDGGHPASEEKGRGPQKKRMSALKWVKSDRQQGGSPRQKSNRLPLSRYRAKCLARIRHRGTRPERGNNRATHCNIRHKRCTGMAIGS
jgi:hypothetical protein